MRNALPWIVAGVLVALAWVIVAREHRDHESERTELLDRVDDLRIENASLMTQVDSLLTSARRHVINSDSLASVPHYIYIEHAARLTRSASLDSLGLLLGADPFTAVPDTLVGDDEPR